VLLLLGCTGTEPLAPPAIDARAAAAMGSGNQLAAPSNVVAVTTSDVSIRITWQDNSNETYFEVSRSPGSPSSGFAWVSTTSANVSSYIDGGVSPSSDYCYQIRAVSMRGRNVTVSPWSSAACTATTPFITVMAAPTSLTAAPYTEVSIVLSWQDNSSDETDFEVHRSTTGPSGAFTAVLTRSANVTSAIDQWLTEGAEYCYMVRAIHMAGSVLVARSPFSNIACTRPTQTTPPAAYATVTWPNNSDAMNVIWDADVGSGFRIDRSTDGGAVWETAGTVFNARYFYDDAAPPERQLCYRVVNYNATGAAQPSNMACSALPAAPTAVTWTQLDASTIQVTWSDNSAVEDGYMLREVVIDCTGGFSGLDCYEYEQGMTVVPANTTSLRTSFTPGLVGVNVYATRDGGFSTMGSSLP
jgi:hypothetical protein